MYFILGRMNNHFKTVKDFRLKFSRSYLKATVVEKEKEGKVKLSQRSFVAHIIQNMEMANNIIVTIVSFKE